MHVTVACAQLVDCYKKQRSAGRCSGSDAVLLITGVVSGRSQKKILSPENIRFWPVSDCQRRWSKTGRVEMWRGGSRPGLSVAAEEPTVELISTNVASWPKAPLGRCSQSDLEETVEVSQDWTRAKTQAGQSGFMVSGKVISRMHPERIRRRNKGNLA